MGYLEQNNAVLKRAFSGLVQQERAAAQAAMERALEQAINYAMEIHENDPVHQQHEDLNGSYAWLVTRKGQEVSRGYYSGGLDSTMNFVAWMNAELDKLASNHKFSGWLGFLVIAQPEFFDFEFEEGVVHATADKLADDFPVYFKFMQSAAI